ncbi:helix-turn-helix domain-containing protein [Escherichia coli]|jgi:transcriptional regulator with XRE-family HTH domain|uniref:Antirepressor protein Cro n=3 Tax=Escherichia coli TaxID=562 RepID=A0A2X7HZY2_ECOLX|nr:YdaS family helix-turn-helix protein [Escherichia coli]EJE8507795.1 helix-turn-helix domain-containing protein [Shigella sonnei]MEC9614246.1 YdaS family helix-turn-helix protein [Escherichia marmotae]EEQ3297929.1 helix-turn-helix domain-containing protein [Escherichia coli]EET0018887.1 helix-turn-helix domain-containing protein [Escherichia coli]EET5525918.1 helix-turn-helix domain-containing protein [Escherichia coli]
MLDSTREKIRQKYTQAEIGRYMGVAQQTVWQWFSFGVPPKQVIPLCQLMKWEVTPHEIRPDIYPNPTDGLPVGCKVNTSKAPELIHENQA